MKLYDASPYLRPTLPDGEEEETQQGRRYDTVRNNGVPVQATPKTAVKDTVKNNGVLVHSAAAAAKKTAAVKGAARGGTKEEEVGAAVPPQPLGGS